VRSTVLPWSNSSAAVAISAFDGFLPKRRLPLFSPLAKSTPVLGCLYSGLWCLLLLPSLS
jgi:hypothetical protein